MAAAMASAGVDEQGRLVALDLRNYNSSAAGIEPLEFRYRNLTDSRMRAVLAAFDCGAIINPDNVRNQVEGALVQGLGGALFESIQFANGRILNPNFADYRVPRFGDMPTIEVVLLDRRDIPPAGAGETPILAITPAIGNAIFQATGRRLRSLPLAPQMVGT